MIELEERDVCITFGTKCTLLDATAKLLNELVVPGTLPFSTVKHVRETDHV